MINEKTIKIKKKSFLNNIKLHLRAKILFGSFLIIIILNKWLNRSLVLWVCKRALQSTVVFCLWDSRTVSQHYKKKDWGSRSTFVPGEPSLKENPLVDMNTVLLPSLHIKLGLMKNFVKALHKNGAAFQNLSTVFPGLSAAKLKEGIFVGP